MASRFKNLDNLQRSSTLVISKLITKANSGPDKSILLLLLLFCYEYLVKTASLVNKSKGNGT